MKFFCTMTFDPKWQTALTLGSVSDWKVLVVNKQYGFKHDENLRTQFATGLHWVTHARSRQPNQVCVAFLLVVVLHFP